MSVIAGKGGVQCDHALLLEAARFQNCLIA